MFWKKNKTPTALGTPEFIVAGLGNPDRKYAYTRHNSGFLCVDALAQKQGFEIKKLKFRSLIADTEINGHRCLVMKPQTYMNNSGEAIRDAAAFYKIPPEKIIVIYDDISLDVGKLRIRRKGSDGGHNGIKSIIYQLGSDQFPRIKIGVGDRADRSEELKDYVLGKFSKTELDELKKELETAVSAAEQIVNGQIDQAMNLYSK